MKIIKKILSGIVALIMLLCVTVLVFAFNPSLTEIAAAKLAGNAGEAPTNQEESPGQISVDGQIGTQILPKPEGLADAVGDYVSGVEEDVAPPEAVRDRNGYEPVQESGEQVEDEAAVELQEGLDTGNTGDGLSFDAQFYPYYHMLNQDMQALYRQIYANVMECNDSFTPIVEVSVDAATNVFEAVYNDHPELFWMETGYSCKYLQSGKCVELTLQYNQTANHLEQEKERFATAAREILSGAEALASEAEKEKYVHDALIQKVDYNAGADMNQSAYSALMNGSSVCAGYARAFQYLMMELGIPCYYCTGYSGENHAWNIILVDGAYYNVDVTWDDTDPSTYDYYNKSDSEYASTHVRKGLSVYLPACGSSVNSDDISSEEENSDSVPSVDSGSVDNLINPNPQEPLEWNSFNDGNFEVDTAEEEKIASLEKAGLSEDQVRWNLTEYYEDCLNQMTGAGAGQQQFANVIPQSMWSSIERIYSDESYRKGYVEEALKKLGMNNFAIQLQAERLDGGYYRLYHNISTW